MKIKDVVHYLEQIAPKAYQEGYDNSGLLTGNSEDEIKGVLITLDITEKVIEEAVSRNCNLIVAHHPIIFKGLKKLTGQNYVERCVISAIQNNIALFAIHTNLDNVLPGVNNKIADKIGLTKRRILAPRKELLLKLETFVPQGQKEAVLEELYAAGAGNVGKYTECSFQTKGVGSFKPSSKANPFIGKTGELEEVHEVKIEVIFPSHLESKILAALRASHPYEEVAYYLIKLDNAYQEVGSGLVGELKNPMEPEKFLEHIKSNMGLNCIRHTKPVKPVKTVALCGGSGAFLIRNAIAAGADAYITADVKYHEFFDAEDQLMIADIGHYESEVFTKDLIYDILTKNFPNFAVNLSEIVTNPISYL